MKSTWLTFVSLVWGPLVFAQTFAPDINQCPRLAPRERPPTGVNDLRPDDIGVIAAIGDRYYSRLLQALFPKIPF